MTTLAARIATSLAARTPTAPDTAPLFTQHATLVLIAAIITGIIAGALAYLAGRNPAQSTLIGGGAAGAALVVFNPLIA